MMIYPVIQSAGPTYEELSARLRLVDAELHAHKRAARHIANLARIGGHSGRLFSSRAEAVRLGKFYWIAVWRAFSPDLLVLMHPPTVAPVGEFVIGLRAGRDGAPTITRVRVSPNHPVPLRTICLLDKPA